VSSITENLKVFIVHVLFLFEAHVVVRYPIEMFLNRWALCLSCLSACLFCSILMYISIAVTSFKGPNGKYEPELLAAYWSVLRFPLVVCFFLMVTGVFSFFFMIGYGTWINCPDRAIAKTGARGSVSDPTARVTIMEASTIAGIIGPAALTWLFAGMAIASKTHAYAAIAKKAPSEPTAGEASDTAQLPLREKLLQLKQCLDEGLISEEKFKAAETKALAFVTG